ncbi:hypothetical protein COO58_17570 [Micromonospora sp. WMMA1996]|nr:hypothetical protein COO58_17570 [Micromonospora sp. WMMA1996]
MGCVEGITVKKHYCAGDKELVPYGGTCQCRRAGCGPSPMIQAGATNRRRADASARASGEDLPAR